MIIKDSKMWRQSNNKRLNESKVAQLLWCVTKHYAQYII